MDRTARPLAPYAPLAWYQERVEALMAAAGPPNRVLHAWSTSGAKH